MFPSHPSLRSLCPRLAWLLGLMFLAGLAGCGPAPSDEAAHVETRASLGGPFSSPPVTLATTPVPPISVNGTGAKPGMGTLPGRDSLQVLSVPSSNPVDSPDTLVVPAWIAKELNSPDVRVRLQALDRWAQQGPEASLGPLVMALDDADDDVRTKAVALIERQWAVAQEAELKAVP